MSVRRGFASKCRTVYTAADKNELSLPTVLRSGGVNGIGGSRKDTETEARSHHIDVLHCGSCTVADTHLKGAAPHGHVAL